MTKVCMTNNFSFKEYTTLAESLDSKVGTLHRDEDLEIMAKMSLPTIPAKSVSVLYTDRMNDSNLRLIKFYNNEDNVEYHIHNQENPMGSTNPKNRGGLIDALKIIHHDAKNEIFNNHRKIVLQTFPGSPHHQSFQSIAKHIAAKYGRTVSDGGLKPFTTNPFFKGPTIVIE